MENDYVYDISFARSKVMGGGTHKCHQHQPIVDPPAAAMAEELDREPHYDQEEGDRKEDRQGGNVVLLRPGRDAALALAQAFGDQALLDRAGRLHACCNLGLVAVVDAEAGCVCRRAGGSVTAQHRHGAVYLFGAARLWLARDIPRLSRVAFFPHGRTGSCIGRARRDQHLQHMEVARPTPDPLPKPHRRSGRQQPPAGKT